MMVALGLADLAGDGPLGALKGVHADHAGKQRRSHHPAAAGAVALAQRGEDSERAVHAGEQVGDRNTNALNVVGPRTGERHETRLALGDLVVSRPAAFRPVVTEPADRQDDQPRVEFGEPFGREAQSVQHTGPEVLEQDVGPAHHLLERLPALVGLQVQRDRPLVAIRRQEVGGFAFGVLGLDEGRPPGPGVVPTLGALHLDDVGTEVAQHHGRVGAGERPRQIDDHGAGQRARSP
jgi:hypothetical protein